MMKITHAQTVLTEDDLRKLKEIVITDSTQEALSEAAAFTLAHNRKYRAWREAQKCQ